MCPPETALREVVVLLGIFYQLWHCSGSGRASNTAPYLSLVTGTLIATVISDAISHLHNAFQLSTVAFGCPYERALIIVNAHRRNYVLSNVVQKANAEGDYAFGCFPVAWTGRKIASPPASRARVTTTCMRASSKRRSCSPHRRSINVAVVIATVSTGCFNPTTLDLNANPGRDELDRLQKTVNVALIRPVT
jgi:hypothetical protein